jgi:hypothetical protein
LALLLFAAKYLLSEAFFERGRWPEKQTSNPAKNYFKIGKPLLL